jgi:hypothetical protein
MSRSGVSPSSPSRSVFHDIRREGRRRLRMHSSEARHSDDADQQEQHTQDTADVDNLSGQQ